ncbi:hypothetical protein P154DRAFT_498871 [Amniculicola lignicola CBS 123094]|uniref:Autophagy-related protein 1 n=1 Tax=Amniculicola lignicola CBS 123094 TaxID=1392246 RepID=A0A6A5W4S5_9PLEO|nr:hypothetical protein P154DRAFT_498871 [Amniculicola lignicola CBS 123094]
MEGPSQQTQQLTQPAMDPRRQGQNNSGLDERDSADVLVILHPASPAAIKIVEDAAVSRPYHVLLRHSYDSFDDGSDIEEQETIIIDRPPVPLPSHAGADIALRMSSPLKQAKLGFIFGRNAGSADIVFNQDAGKRISNQHFRIFLNHDAVIMVEDMSTNGTIVDDILLKNRDTRHYSKERMLASGSIICVQNSNDAEMIKFVVRIPSRVNDATRYQENLHAWFMKCEPDQRRLKGKFVLERLEKSMSKGPSMKWDGGQHYNIIGHIGKGAFATVYQLATKMEGKLLAAKELEKRRFIKNGLLDKKIDNEMKIMQNLRHPNIVEFVDYHDQGDYLYIIMEYVRYGDLQHYLMENGTMPEDKVRTMAQQILKALGYVHRMQITHRDIKPDNILIASREPFQVKLSDFGLSKVVTSDETFLKTFCGTLLYCAPEVFPDFEGAPARGTKRRRGAKQQFHSYSSSVDIWSFAGVLWFCLCGKPPFEGIADQTGKAMYTNIMTTPLDSRPLKDAGISDACIDLLCRMLQTDPSRRPTDLECLRHPWLDDGAKLPADPTLQSIVEEDEADEAEQELSQLSLREEVPDSDDELDAMLEDDDLAMLATAPQVKKVRIDRLFPRNQMRDFDHDTSANVSFISQHVSTGNEVEESFPPVMPSARPIRLFGEIGESALQSSVVLDAHATEALSRKGSSDDGLPQNRQTRHASPEQSGRAPIKGAFSSPSLLGTESMVRELNMASPHSPISRTQSFDEPTTPKTPEVPQHNSLEGANHHMSQFSDSTPKAKQPPTFNRQISLPKTPSFYYDPRDPSTHTLEYASKVSGFDFVGTVGARAAAEALPDTMRLSAEQDDTSQGAVSNASSLIPLVPDIEIKPPPRRLGKLTATADSFVPGLTLMIDQSRTSWGRLLENTIVYEDGYDTRIPKLAFVIFWWRSQGETVQELSQQGKDWTSAEDLHVGIFTGATSGISINGKHLRKKDEKERANYGHLHSGDIIQVFADSKGQECLRFKCEFYHGSGREPRTPGEGFTVLKGEGKWGLVKICPDQLHSQPASRRAKILDMANIYARSTSYQHTSSPTHFCFYLIKSYPATMRSFWALPAVLRIALATQHAAYSVFDDLLAFPQYQVEWANTYVTEQDATAMLSRTASRSTNSATPNSQETQELSKAGKSSTDTSHNDQPREETYEALVLGGQRYLCSVPVIPDEGPSNSTATAEQVKAEEEKELMRATDRGWELLEGMKGNCIYYLSGWWSYSFCYKDEVRQFHQLPPSRGVPIYPPVEDNTVKSFVLGRFPEKDKKVKAKQSQKTLGKEEGSKEQVDDEGNETPLKGMGSEVARLETRGQMRYMVQRLGLGTVCDLTGKDRKIEVQFHCNPQSMDKISMIKETSTCAYLMIIHTPRLCGDVAFHPPQENLAHPISCQPVYNDAEALAHEEARVDATLSDMERIMGYDADTPLSELNPGLNDKTKHGPIIGGIEVGAKLLVGSEGKVIEKTVVVGGGKETYIGTIAASDGTQMSAAEMKKLDIVNPKDVEKLKGNLRKLAGRKGWKLDLVDTPRGREFRGIIEADDEEEEVKKGGSESGSEEKGKGMKKEGAAKGEQREEEPTEEGSEEVYKDEL